MTQAADPAAILEVLTATLSPSKPIRSEAEARLARLAAHPHYLPTLFTVVTAPQCPSPQRLAATLVFKNLVKAQWDQSLAPDVKRQIRPALLRAMAASEKPIRAQLKEVIKRIIVSDFPHHFPELLPYIAQGLQAQDARVVDAAALVFRVLVKVYEFKCSTVIFAGPRPTYAGTTDEEEMLNRKREADVRMALKGSIESFFPTLLAIMNKLEDTIIAESAIASGGGVGNGQITTNRFSMSNTAQSLQNRPGADAGITTENMRGGSRKWHEMQKTICKIFLSSIQSALPACLVGKGLPNMERWLAMFLRVFKRPVVVDSAENLGADELPKLPQWKVKQRICQIVLKLFQRYGNLLRMDNITWLDNDPRDIFDFAARFRKKWAAQFAETMIALLYPDRKTISCRVANLCLIYLESCVAPGDTFKVIRPQLEQLLLNVIFPYLCVNDDDLAIWKEDPVEFVRKTYDVAEDFYSPRAAAASLVFTLSKLRPLHVIPPFVGFLSRILDAYERCDPQDARRRFELAKQKDGALFALGTMKEKLLLTRESRQQTEALLRQHVMPDFTSGFAFLRARACWFLGQMCMNNLELAPDAVFPGLDGVWKCLQDPEFPVRVRAAVDMRYFLSNGSTAKALGPMLQVLLEQLFTLLNDIDNTDIVATVEQIVNRFGEQIVPYVQPLVLKLVDTFTRTASADNDDDESALAATQCIQTIETIVNSLAHARIANKAEMFDKMENMLEPILSRMFEESRIEFFEESLELLSTLLYYGAEARQEARARLQKSSGTQQTGKYATAISQYLWSLFPLAVVAFHELCGEFSVNYLHAIDSYLCKDSSTFLRWSSKGVTFRQMFLGIMSSLWEDMALDNDDAAVYGARLSSIYLQYCPGVHLSLSPVADEREAERVRGLIATDVGIMAEMAVNRLRSNKGSRRATLAILRSISHMMYREPDVVLDVIDKELGCAADIFSAWIRLVQKDELQTKLDRKCTVVGLLSVLRVGRRELPAVLLNCTSRLLMLVVGLLEHMQQDMSARKQKFYNGQHEQEAGKRPRANFASDCDGEAFGYMTEDGEDGDVDPALAMSDDQTSRLLMGSAEAELKRMAERNDWVGASDPALPDSFVYEDEEGSLFSNLDEVDELAYFEKVMVQMEATEASAMMNEIGPENSNRIRALIDRARGEEGKDSEEYAVDELALMRQGVTISG